VLATANNVTDTGDEWSSAAVYPQLIYRLGWVYTENRLKPCMHRLTGKTSENFIAK
jgi:hypothetical protein